VRKPGRSEATWGSSAATCKRFDTQPYAIRGYLHPTPEAFAGEHVQKPGRSGARCERSLRTWGSPRSEIRTIRSDTRTTPHTRATRHVGSRER
jgi:hypothetical protein